MKILLLLLTSLPVFAQVQFITFPNGTLGLTPEQFAKTLPLGLGTDQLAINAAIAALQGCPTGQGTCSVHLKAGSYTINAPIVITGSGVTLSGSGGFGGPSNPTSIINSSATADSLQVTGTGANCAAGAVYGTTISDFGLLRGNSGATAGYGVKLVDTCFTWVSRLNIVANTAIYLSGAAHTYTTDNNFTCDPVTNSSVTGIEYDDSNANNSSYSSRDGYKGTGCGNYVGFYIHGGNIEDYTIRDFMGVGGKFGILITSTYAGGSFGGFNGDGHIIDPIIEGPTTAVIQVNNLYAGGLSALDISGGHINTNASSGILIDLESCDGVVVRGVQVPANSSVSSIGIKVAGANTGVNSFIGNNIRSVVTGFLLNGVTGQTLIGNIVAGFSTNAVTTAISLTGSSNNLISGNAVKGTVTTAISLDATSNNNIAGPNNWAASLISNSGSGNVLGTLPGSYSAAGTALPSCVSTLDSLEAWVTDATAPTIGGSYTSGGTVKAKVVCRGTTWLTF